MSRNKLYSERLEVCLTPAQMRFLKQAAKKDEVTINEYVRSMINLLLS